MMRTFLYYIFGVDPTVLTALIEIANQQFPPTKNSETACNQLLNYLHINPLVILQYHTSGMTLCLVSDVAYLVLLNARNRCATLFILINQPSSHPPNPKPNGPLHVMVKPLKESLHQQLKPELEESTWETKRHAQYYNSDRT